MKPYLLLELQNFRQVIFNEVHEKPNVITNLLFLVAKYYMYRMRCAMKLQNVNAFKCEINIMKQIEY